MKENAVCALIFLRNVIYSIFEEQPLQIEYLICTCLNYNKPNSVCIQLCVCQEVVL